MKPEVLQASTNKEPIFYVDDNGFPHATVSTLNIGSLITTHLLGRVLTIIDASIADSRQCKAAKDLVKQTMWEAFDEVREWMMVNTKSRSNEDEAYYHSRFPFADNRSIE